MNTSRNGMLSVADALATDGAAYIPGDSIRPAIPARSIERLEPRWGELGTDLYLPQRATYRTRRYGRMLARCEVDGSYSFEALPHGEFKQAADLIPLYRGNARSFAPIAAGTLLSEPMLAMVRADLRIISTVEGVARTFAVGLHMVRITASYGEARPPAPEGRHRDGHRYVAMHLIARRRCSGGESLIYREGAAHPFLRTTLTSALDSLIVDDRRVEHEVTPISAQDSGAVRDMLLVDFDDSDDIE